jgi:ribosome-binding protein aMBF1 (putative translation factor)
MTGHEREHTAFAGALRCLREQRGMSREQLAVWAGTSSSTVYRIERGESSPTFENMTSIARVLGITLSELVAAAEGGDMQ